MTREEFIAKLDTLWEEIGQSEEINTKKHKSSMMGGSTEGIGEAKFSNCGTLRNQYGLPVRFVAMVELGSGKFYSTNEELAEINKHLAQIGSIRDYFSIVSKTYLHQSKSIFTNELQMFNVLNGSMLKLDQNLLSRYPDYNIITEMKDIGDDVSDNDLGNILSSFFTISHAELKPSPITEEFDYKILCKDFVLFIMKGDAPDAKKYGESSSIMEKANVVLIPRKASDDFYHACTNLYKILQACPFGNFVEFKYSIGEARAIGEFYQSDIKLDDIPNMESMYNTGKKEEEP